MGDGSYSIIWRGFLTIRETGAYRFSLVGDDAAQFSIDGRLTLDANIAARHPSDEKQVALAAGKHPIEVRFRNAEGGQSFEFDWTTPRRGGRESIPLEVLSPY